MGFFSWKTQNTNRSIANVYSPRETFNVALIDNKKNVWKESFYEGYGIFGGKDFYELVHDMNKDIVKEMNKKNYSRSDKRSYGIFMEEWLNNNPDVELTMKWPNLIEDINNEVNEWVWVNEEPEYDPAQGHFY